MERRTLSYGGGGGGPFPPRHPHSVGLRTGGYVDAIILNGDRFGGEGGGATPVETLDGDDYWCAFELRSGEYVDRLKLTSKKGRTVEGGGDGGSSHALDGLRIIAISGRCGEFVDALTFDVVTGYQPSTVVERNQDVVLDVETGGEVIKHYSSESSKTAHSFQVVSQHMLSTDTNVSAQGEYFAKFSASTDIKTSDSRTETIASQAEQAMESGESSEQTIPADSAAFLIGKADIMKDSDGNYWMAPTSGSNWVVLASNRFHELAGKYDLTGGARTQTGLGCSVVNGFPKLS